MGVYDLFPEAAPRVYLTIRELDHPPILVWRRDDVNVVLLTVDPRFSALEITEACVDRLSTEENDLLRAAFGMPQTPQPLPDWAADDEVPCFLFVPKGIRLPWQPALQGGKVLAARRKANDLDAEWAAYMDEIRQTRARRGA